MKVDGANGVGADKLERTMRHIQGDLLSVKVYNNGAGVLNERVSTLLYHVALLPSHSHTIPTCVGGGLECGHETHIRTVTHFIILTLQDPT